MEIKVNIKDPNIRKFIIARYGEGDKRIAITMKSLLGQIIELSCQKIGFLHVLPKSEPVADDECLIFILPTSLKNVFVHPNKHFVLTKVLESHFNEIFLTHVETFVEIGISDYQAVSSFIEKYGFDYNAKLEERLRKKWRNRQDYLRRKMKNKVG
jgi:hypothetical protein